MRRTLFGTVLYLALYLAPVVQKLDSAILWINYYPVDSAIHLLNNWDQYC